MTKTHRQKTESNAQEKKSLTAAFNKLAAHYEKTMSVELFRFWNWSYADLIHNLTPQHPINTNSKILDLATATARVPRQLAQQASTNFHIVGLDITPSMLEHGRECLSAEKKTAASISLVCASAHTTPFANKTFDAVLCGLGAHHMNVPKMLAEAQRVLKPQGKLIIVEAASSTFWRSGPGKLLLRLLLFTLNLNPNSSAAANAASKTLNNLFTIAEWQTMLSNAGFADITIRTAAARRPWYPRALIIQTTRPER